MCKVKNLSFDDERDNEIKIWDMSQQSLGLNISVSVNSGFRTYTKIFQCFNNIVKKFFKHIKTINSANLMNTTHINQLTLFSSLLIFLNKILQMFCSNRRKVKKIWDVFNYIHETAYRWNFARCANNKIQPVNCTMCVKGLTILPQD